MFDQMSASVGSFARSPTSVVGGTHTVARDILSVVAIEDVSGSAQRGAAIDVLLLGRPISSR
jgi:hypothetical protein